MSIVYEENLHYLISGIFEKFLEKLYLDGNSKIFKIKVSKVRLEENGSFLFSVKKISTNR